MSTKLSPALSGAMSLRTEAGGTLSPKLLVRLERSLMSVKPSSATSGGQEQRRSGSVPTCCSRVFEKPSPSESFAAGVAVGVGEGGAGVGVTSGPPCWHCTPSPWNPSPRALLLRNVSSRRSTPVPVKIISLLPGAAGLPSPTSIVRELWPR